MPPPPQDTAATHRIAIKVTLIHALLVVSIYGGALMFDSEELYAVATVIFCALDFTIAAIAALVVLIAYLMYELPPVLRPWSHDSVIAATLLFAIFGSAHWYIFTLLILRFSRFRAFRWLTLGRCPQCGYNLRGSARFGCPECGWSRDGARRPDQAGKEATQASAPPENSSSNESSRDGDD